MDKICFANLVDYSTAAKLSDEIIWQIEVDQRTDIQFNNLININQY